MSLLDFIFNRQPQKPACPMGLLSREWLETVRLDVSRAQALIDRTSQLSEVSVSDHITAAHSLRLAQITLTALTEQVHKAQGQRKDRV